MDTKDLRRRMSLKARISQAKAADELDEAITEVVTQLRDGMAAILPGLGVLVPGENQQIVLEAVEERGVKKRARK